MSSSSSLPPSSVSSLSHSELPLKPIPGDYGLPFFGAIKDRLDYFYNEGTDKFFETKMKKYQSTIFRTNLPPGPFIAPNPKVICLLDAVSFPVLFDNSKVEKRDIFVATYHPSWSFTGGYRVCPYVDPSEPKHTPLKSFFFSMMASRHNKFIPLFQTALKELFLELEDELFDKKTAYFNTISDKASFNHLFRLFCDKSPADTKIGSDGSTLLDKWLLFQLAPLATLGVPKFLNCFEDLLLHTFPLPYFLVKSNYEKVYSAFLESATSALNEAEKFGLKRAEACHNLIFLTCFNSYGGTKVLFPSLFKWVGLAGESLHRQLADEIRTVVKAEGGVTFSSLEKMPLTKSVVYEVLRIEPPVAIQYGKAKADLVVHTHDAAFEIKKGETIAGYQPFATKDPKIFENPKEFVPHRFVGKGEKLLKYVYWSNGRETDDPTAEDKQCPGKNLVVLWCRVLLVEFFLRYDTFEVDVGTILLGPAVTFKSLTKASTSEKS